MACGVKVSAGVAARAGAGLLCASLAFALMFV
jgi:hypothetical protein